MEKVFVIDGMHCAACAAGIESYLKFQDGIESVSVNLVTEKMTVDFDESALSCEDISGMVKRIGYSAAEYVPFDAAADAERARARADADKSLRRRMITALCFAALLMYVSMGHMIGLPLPRAVSMENHLYHGLLQLVLTVPVLICGHHIYASGLKALSHLRPNMDSLVAIGTAAAFIYSLWNLISMALHGTPASLFFESSAMVIALIMVGKYMEDKSKGRASEAISRLSSLLPDTALVTRHGQTGEILTRELKVGDTVTVLPGGRFPCDGVVTAGSGSADMSMMTGESMPVPIDEGSPVTGGCINCESRIEYRATRVGGDTVLSSIIQMVEDAQEKKAPIARIADRVAGVFVPAVMAIAAAAAIVWAIAGKDAAFVLNIFVAVLVIACPCSLGLATPIAILVGTGRGAEMGILYKSGESIQKSAEIDAMAFDKTGTLTLGKPQITGMSVAPGSEESRILALTASAESSSEHPVAAAIVEKARQAGLELPPCKELRAIPGRGIEAQVNNARLLVGNGALMEEHGIPHPADPFPGLIGTVMYCAVDGRYSAAFLASDDLRPDSAPAVARLEKLGIASVMLTGDNAVTAAAIAAQAGIRDYRADILPGDKAAAVRELEEKYGRAAMVGDGVNDAPAMAEAYVGIAMGTGTDVAVEAADVVIMSDEMNALPDCIGLSRAVMRNIRQNLFWAFIYNCCGIPFAAGVVYALGGPLLSPVIAGAAMALSSISVVTNALRLRRYKSGR